MKRYLIDLIIVGVILLIGRLSAPFIAGLLSGPSLPVFWAVLVLAGFAGVVGRIAALLADKFTRRASGIMGAGLLASGLITLWWIVSAMRDNFLVTNDGGLIRLEEGLLLPVGYMEGNVVDASVWEFLKIYLEAPVLSLAVGAGLLSLIPVGLLFQRFEGRIDCKTCGNPCDSEKLFDAQLDWFADHYERIVNSIPDGSRLKYWGTQAAVGGIDQQSPIATCSVQWCPDCGSAAVVFGTRAKKNDEIKQIASVPVAYEAAMRMRS